MGEVRRSKNEPVGSPPPGTRLYAVGDVHGCRDLLAHLRDQIVADAARAAADRFVIVYLGDYVDRGPDSKGVVDMLLREPLPGFQSVHLRGNHELEMLQFLHEESQRFDWIAYGGAETLRSYGVEPPRKPSAIPRVRREFAEMLPADHLAFYSGLGTSYQDGDFFFAHAGVAPDVPLHQQAEDDLLWIRTPFLKSNVDFGKIVVHGHTIVDRPERRPNRIGIDTGAFRSGRLTAVVLQDGEIEFLRT